MDKGKKQLVLLIIATYLFDIASTIFTTYLYDKYNMSAYVQKNILQFLIRFMITIIICAYLYRGYKWAKSFIQFCSLLGVILTIIFFKRFLSVTNIAYVLLIQGFICSIFFCVLAFSKSIKAYVSSQTIARLKYRLENEESDDKT